jgi:hypothetical protein
MRRLFLFLMGATFFSSMKADGEFPYLTFVGSDGTVTSLGVESLEMTVTEDGNLVAVNSDGSKTFTLTSLAKMYFSTGDESTASRITMTEAESTENEVEVFTLTGISLGKFTNSTKAKESLKHGVYILKSKSQTFKITVR